MSTDTVTNANPYATEQEYRAAVAVLAEAAAAYYNGDTPLMIDADWDVGVAKVAATETAHPDWIVDHGLLDQVSAGTAGGDIAHSTPMLSLGKVHSDDPEALAAWWDRLCRLLETDTPPVVIEPKADGIALAVRYENGTLAKVITRGDGTHGENVTDRIPHETVGMPLTLPAPLTFEVRGEAVFTAEQYAAANAQRTASGKAAFVNPRNALAGTVRREDLDTSDRPAMTFLAYDVLGLDANSGCPADSDAYSVKMRWLHDHYGFVSAMLAAGPGEPVSSINDIRSAIDAIGADRSMLPFDIDGAVVKVDLPEHRSVAGATGSHPRWALAYKYPAEEATTVVRDVQVSVGRTGRLGVRYLLDPVFVGGTTVSYATGHHPGMVTELGVAVGATVIIKRAGDVIPYVVGVTAVPEGADPWQAPTECPRCGAGINKDTLLWRCERGRACGSTELLQYAASRGALDMDGLGDKTIAMLVDAGLVTDLASLFDLTVDDIAALPGMGETSAAIAFNAIQSAKTQPLGRFLTALGLSGTGRSMSRRIARHFGTLDAVRAATVEQMAEVEGLGDKKAPSVVAELEEMADLIDALQERGVGLIPDENHGDDDDGSDKPLAGMKVCVTGAMTGPLASYKRDEMKDLIARLGGDAVGSVSKTTSLLVAAEAGSSKYTKAESLGVPILSPDEFAAKYGIE